MLAATAGGVALRWIAMPIVSGMACPSLLILPVILAIYSLVETIALPSLSEWKKSRHSEVAPHKL
ncbi:MAG: hypothetical protein AAF967_02935 [Pseudomonadota bacterium]